MPDREHTGNFLLDAIPTRRRADVLAHAEFVHLPVGQFLFHAAEPIRMVHFPVNGVLSLVTVLEDGSAVEVWTIGNEGTTAAPVFLGVGAMPSTQCITQIAGDAIAMRSSDFRREIDQDPELRDLLLRYTGFLFTQAAQSVACSRLHNTTQRSARWLLLTHDRVGADQFQLSHEFLAFMLGARRASVTDALGPLNKAGVIRSYRGTITILDRVGLEKFSCECYKVIQQAAARMRAP